MLRTPSDFALIYGKLSSNEQAIASQHETDPLAFDESVLPTSSAEGVVRLPFSQPMPGSKPEPVPPLAPQQKAKYQDVLNAVSSWTTLPTVETKDAPVTPIKDHERMFLTHECLLRYLRASKWHVQEAIDRLKSTLVWRREYEVENLTAEYISVENETGKLINFGYDKHCRPCLYMRPSQQNTQQGPRQIQHLVYMLERILDLSVPGQETLSILINFQSTKASQNPSLRQGKETLHILQRHYPERLGRAMVINIPMVVNLFFKGITPLIDPATRGKLKFNQDLKEHVPACQLLEELGGSVKFSYDHSLYWPAMNLLASKRREEYRQRWVSGGRRIGEYEDYLKGGSAKSLAEVEKLSAPEEASGKENQAA